MYEHGALYVRSQRINLLIEILQRSDAAVLYTPLFDWWKFFSLKIYKTKLSKLWKTHQRDSMRFHNDPCREETGF